MYGCTELRKVRAGSLNQIAEILDDDDAWKTVASLIPKDLSSVRFTPKYNSDHVRSIEKHAKENKVKCAIVLFDEWGSSGINRPTLHTLRSILIKADMFRAADVLSKLINENPPPRPEYGPGAHINTPSSGNSGSSEQDTYELNQNHIETEGSYTFRRIPTRKIGSATTVENTEGPIITNPNNYNVPNLQFIVHHSTKMISNKNS